MIEYDILQDCLDQLEADVETAELHGSLCGVLCALGSMQEQHWLSLVFPERDPQRMSVKDIPAEQYEVLTQCYRDAMQLLNENGIDFYPLLPDDTEQIDVRVTALADWCRGFLFGLSEGGVRDMDALPEDVTEVIEDFVSISQAGAEGLEEEEAESQLMEIEEYVRVGVLLVNEELQPMQHPPVNSDSTVQIH